MPRFLRRLVAVDPAVDGYVPQRGLVASRAAFPSARTVATVIAVARTGIGVGFAAAPVTALRLLGLDTATAARVAWLSQMTAARDGVLGAGTLAATARGRAAPWLLAGAVADAADAAALAGALRARRIGGPNAVPMIGAAALAALAGIWAAGSLTTAPARRAGRAARRPRRS